MPSDHDLAWALADHIAPDLVDHDKTAIYVDLGCRNGWEAIGHMLNVTVRDQLRLPEALICQIAVWLDGYAGTADEPTLRELLRRRQRSRNLEWDSPAVSLIGEVQVADVPGRCEPGTGEINYSAIAVVLKEMGYRGTVGLEAYASGQDKVALERFSSVFGAGATTAIGRQED